MRVSLVLVVLLAGCSQVQPVQEAAPEPVLEGLVLDVLYRPLPDATITWNGTAISVDGNGSFRLIGPAAGDVVVAAAPGFESQAMTVPGFGADLRQRHEFFLSPLPRDGFHDTQVFEGLIACGFIVQYGHTHGGGGPEDDNHVTCDALEENKNVFQYVPERDPQDLLLELIWTPGSEWATHMTLILRDDTGEVIAFEEGTSPLRMEVAALLVQERLGEQAIIQVVPGIPDGNVADVYVGAHVDQRFEVHATSFHGMDMPAHWTVQS